jgi:hypothetical protein
MTLTSTWLTQTSTSLKKITATCLILTSTWLT